jgi:hypothetical protein
MPSAFDHKKESLITTTKLTIEHIRQVLTSEEMKINKDKKTNKLPKITMSIRSKQLFISQNENCFNYSKLGYYLRAC